MKIWQNPGETKAAEWLCLSDDKDWDTNGGMWAKQVDDPATLTKWLYLVIVVHDADYWQGEEQDPCFHAHVRRLDLSAVTLPELKRVWSGDWSPLGRGRVSVLDAARGLYGDLWPHGFVADMVGSGRGEVVGQADAPSVRSVRTEAKRIAEEFILRLSDDEEFAREATTEEIPRSHHRRWDRIRRKNPVDYMAGFLLGMQRSDTKETDPALLAGWEHGWEYAVGRVPLPQWFVRSARKSLVEGGE
jgi:hypothetical protein